jgi:glycosyl transferase family 25
MHAYVINLARSRDRRAHITAQLRKTGIDYEIVTAVDGHALDLGDTSLIDPGLFDHTQLRAGTAGAALSHQGVYKKIIADGLDKALVLEDDVTVPDDLASLADAMAGHLTGAEVALLSYDAWQGCKLSQEGAIPLPSGRLLALPIDISQPRSGGAYVITREACERMCKSFPPVQVNADFWWFFYREGIIDRVRCVAPLQVRKTAELESTMGSYSLGTSLKGRLAYALVRRKVPVIHQMAVRRRQRIYQEWGRAAEVIDEPFVEKPSRLG